MATARRVSAPLDAYVLHRYDWSETSLILDLFTRSKGRVTVAAKGAKRPYSQLRSVLLPFQRIDATIGRQAEDAQADVVTMSQNFDNFAGLQAAGWVFTNNSADANQSWFAGNSGIFEAQSGAPGS